MFLALGLAVLLQGTGTDTTYRELFQSGRTIEVFVDAAKMRAAEWKERFRTGTPPEDLVARARAAGPGFRLLIVAEDRCGDSANIVPFVGRFATAAGIELRIVDSTAGRAIMEAHRTPDDRAATPTILLLDQDYRGAGVFVERPDTLQTWWLDQEKKLDRDELLRQKYDWYAKDRGRTSIEQIVQLLEARTRTGGG